jgi:hypothetical protein
MNHLTYTPPIPATEMTALQNANQRQALVKKPSNFEIFQACVNDLTGKDKLAKLVQYFIRFITSIHNVHGLGNPKTARSFKSSLILNNASDESLSFNDNVKTEKIINTSSITYILPLISRLLFKSSSILSNFKLQKLLLILLAFITNKLSGLLNGLNIYRHLLRAGTIPFRVWKFSHHIRHSLKILLDRSKLDGAAVRLEKVLQYWTTKDMISQIANFWYAISDEILLIFRFNILNNEAKNGSRLSNALFLWAENNELYAWMATILLGLSNDWNKWLTLKDKESRIILNQKVKARTKRIVGDLKRQNQNRISSPDIVDNIENTDYDEDIEEFDTLYKNQLDIIHNDMNTIYINSIRLSCDLVFDAKYIFHWNMYTPLHVSLGFASGCLGLVNVWRSQHDRLLKEAILKAEGI